MSNNDYQQPNKKHKRKQRSTSKKKGGPEFFASVTGQDKSGMTISSATFEDAFGNKTTLINKEVKVTADDAQDESEHGGSATLSVPVEDPTKADVVTSGAGRVILTKPQPPFYISLLGGKKEMKATDETYFARLTVESQRNQKIQKLDILFSKKGEQRHAHVSIKSDGSGHYIDFRGGKGALECDASYIESDGVVVPKRVVLEDKETGKKVELLFEIDLDTRNINVKHFDFLN